MLFKYRVEFLDETGEIKESWDYQKKKDVSADYNIPMYLIDKIIRKTNDPQYTTKREAHYIYRDLMNTMKIHLIKPSFT